MSAGEFANPQSLIAARISADRLMTVAMIVGAFSLVAGVVTMYIMPPVPSWMLIEMPLYLVAAWAAAKLEQKRRSRTA